MVWERNDTGTNAKDHAWVDLAMRPSMCMSSSLQTSSGIKLAIICVGVNPSLLQPRILQVFGCHRDHDCLFFFRVKQLNDTTLDQLLPLELLSFIVNPVI